MKTAGNEKGEILPDGRNILVIQTAVIGEYI